MVGDQRAAAESGEALLGTKDRAAQRMIGEHGGQEDLVDQASGASSPLCDLLQSDLPLTSERSV
ncbi:MAG: hypothetical protein HW416_2340, partial [Chloroflexi bacterium]|nr:hypothetical protein [Chloroflexota bacterium]